MLTGTGCACAECSNAVVDKAGTIWYHLVISRVDNVNRLATNCCNTTELQCKKMHNVVLPNDSLWSNVFNIFFFNIADDIIWENASVQKQVAVGICIGFGFFNS